LHIADGVMAPIVWITAWVVSLAVLGIVFWRMGKGIDERTVPLMAVLAAGIFVAQMLNFPIGGGTTGHLVGATLATILLGPYAAMLIMTVILVIQSLVFGDGGLTALGLNILNMAIIAPLVTFGILAVFGERRRILAVPIAAWASVFLTATVCAAQLAISFSVSGGFYGIPGALAFPAMMGVYAIIAVGEAIITTGVVLFLAKVSPGMLNMHLRPTEA
jgi:cobalt/nickel transport system permease protein